MRILLVMWLALLLSACAGKDVAIPVNVQAKDPRPKECGPVLRSEPKVPEADLDGEDSAQAVADQRREIKLLRAERRVCDAWTAKVR